ncbi:hypothetical protein [Hydrogenophaga laconesensis]|uniref:Uncharacterized protein n=1 Tax=Hydrogenophaga laconesensis TaxID=1805971 RepID=A0ABU1VDJ6_9BURK|nr:hypothetical protein [Hydrogenophaga laconesensis]MDR7095527.1 hypothetical protein [Hydrogenophaga laconesensis]
MKVLPSAPEVLRESLVLIGGAILAALILQQLPQLRSWISQSTKGCDCEH